MKTIHAYKKNPLVINGTITESAPLKDFTTYKIGGPAALLVQPTSIHDIKTCFHWCQTNNRSIIPLGGGSNVLAPDSGIDAVVIYLGPSFSHIEHTQEGIIAQAGVSDEQLALFAASHSYCNYHFLYDIPGHVGGAIVQNAGMYEFTIADILLWVKHLDPSGKAHTTFVDDLALGYRHSKFKHEFKGHIICEACFKATPTGNKEDILAQMHDIRSTRRNRYPMEYANCGSVFKRPTGDYAGRLIQAANLGGYQHGQAAVSAKHHNFIVNLGGAHAQDIQAVVSHVQKTIKDSFKISLERELIYLEEQTSLE